MTNPVSTLDFGTLGWLDAGYPLNHGPENPLHAIRPVDLAFAKEALAPLAESYPTIDADELQTWLADTSRTTYALGVRLPEDYDRVHLRGSVSAPAGQLGINLGRWVAVLGARLVLIDAEPGVRALTDGRDIQRFVSSGGSAKGPLRWPPKHSPTDHNERPGQVGGSMAQ